MTDEEREALMLLGIPEDELQDPSEADQPTFMQQVAEASGWTDQDIGSVMGVGASAVANYRSGYRRFRPVPAQRDALRTLLANQIVYIRSMIETLDKMQTR